MSNEFDKNQLVDIFVAESSDAVSSMQAALNPADQSLPSHQVAHEQKALAHRTKGAALLYEFPTLGKLCDMLEHLLERATDFSSSDWPRVVGTLRALVDAAQVQINAIARRLNNYRFSVTFNEPIEPEGSASNPDDIRAFLTKIFAGLEAHIRVNPEQWVLLQHVWPPDDATGDNANNARENNGGG